MNSAYRGGWKVKPGGVRFPDPSVINDDWEDDGPTVDWGEYAHDPVADLLDEIQWTDVMLREAHAGFVAGKRDVVTVEGHRLWDARYRAQKRAAARLSPVDREWCERAAEAHFWVAYEAANRRGGSETLQRIAEQKTKTMLR